MDEFYRIKRLPPYVFAIVNDLKTKARARGEDVIDLGMGNPDMPTPKHIVDKLIEAAKNPKNHRYSASRGITRLRRAMATWYHDRYAVELDPDAEVIATIGAKEGMAHLSLAVLGAKDVGVEIFSLSKSYNMPGWRMGFVCGNARMIAALARIKSYLDYGAFQPIQIASIIALEGDQKVVDEIVEVHRKRRDVLVDGLNKLGWEVPKPKGTMFVWAPIPEPFRAMGSLEFAKLCIQEAKVAVSPGIGFGEYGEGYVRFALVENEQRIKQALRGLKHVHR